MLIINDFLSKLNRCVVFVRHGKFYPVGLAGCATSLATPVCSASCGIERLCPYKLDAACRFGKLGDFALCDLTVELGQKVLSQPMFSGGERLFSFLLGILLRTRFAGALYYRRKHEFARRVLVVPIIDEILAPEGIHA
ncbi:hypothetical protein HG530_015506 [Fusarium avenaceum]|nr:hypothetical protein HG530_015506 [Fusarium avenaceum]